MTENDTTAMRRCVLVTGPSGAGRSSAIRVLEDLGYEAIDNMPLRLLDPLLDTPAPERSLALGIDPRTRDFSVSAVEDALNRLAGLPEMTVELLYLDCETSVLLRRFSETRRRHPLADGERVEAGIERELTMLEPLRGRSDILIDTTTLNVHELRAELETHFAPSDGVLLTVSLQSFSYKRGLPRGVDLVFDCRFLDNPYWSPALRQFDGRDQQVQDHIRTDPRCAEFRERIRDLCQFLLPAHREEGKSHLAIAFGCTGGQHRSVAMAEWIAGDLAQGGWQVSIRHRELGARATYGKPSS